MGLLSSVKGFIYSFDLLSSASLLRIKGGAEHTTIVGGIASMSLIVLLITLFYNKIIGTFNKDIISASTLTSHANSPLSYNLTTADKTFMLGIQLWNVDLNTGQRYFDVNLYNSVYRYGAYNTSTIYSLQPCTIDHWEGYPDVQSTFTQLRMEYWLCLPKNISFDIGGKMTSSLSKSIEIFLSQCTASNYDTRPCASSADVSQLFADLGLMYFTIYFINPLINPDSEEYLSYYLEDKNYLTFSQTIGEESRLFVQDYQIDTDESILPIESLTIQTGGLVSDNTIKSVMPNLDGTYALFSFYKSPYSLVFTRSFQKLDEVFSYIGGLLGIILIAFFLVGSYNSCKYEINLAGYLYHSDDKIQKKYNFLYYLGQVFFEILGMVRITPNWQIIKKYNDIGEEVVKQLDILLLLKRINFIEKSLSYLFTDHQLKGLHLASHYTLQQAIKLRKSYKLKPKLKEEMMSKVLGNAADNTIEQFQNLNESIIIANKPFTRDSIQDKNEKEQEFKQINFDSDRYSSESSSSEQQDDHQKQQESIIDSLKVLKKEQDNVVSKRIWNSIDPRFNQIMKASKPEKTHIVRQDIFQYTNGNFQELGIQGYEINTYGNSTTKIKDSSQQLKENIKSKRANSYGKFLQFEEIEVQQFFDPQKQK